MRVNIEHSEVKKGLISKKTYYVVSLTVHFTDEEKQIIKGNDLTKTVILERDVPADENPNRYKGIEDVVDLHIFNIMDGKPNSYLLRTPAEAKQYEANLTEALRTLKAYLEANAGIEEKSKTFEL